MHAFVCIYILYIYMCVYIYVYSFVCAKGPMSFPRMITECS